MSKILFKLILNPDKKLFELTLGEKHWDLTAKETEQLIQNAQKQLVDTTDAMTDFFVEIVDYKMHLKGIKSRQAFYAIVEYLEKVWNSFKETQYYGEIYPQ